LNVFIVPYVMYIYYGRIESYVGFLLFIAKMAILITVMLIPIILDYLLPEQDNKSRKSFLVGKCNGRPFLTLS